MGIPAKLPFRRLPEGGEGLVEPKPSGAVDDSPNDSVSVVSSASAIACQKRKRRSNAAELPSVAQKAVDGHELTAVEFLQAKDWVANC